MRYVFLLTGTVLLGQAPVVSAQAYGDPVAMVDSWYREYLGRTALRDPSSVVWINALRQGSSPASVQSGILGSAEYFNRVGGTLPGFIQTVYQQALARPPSPNELSFWLRRAYLQNRQEIAYEILTQSAPTSVVPAPPVVVVPHEHREHRPHHDEHDYRRPYYPFRW